MPHQSWSLHVLQTLLLSSLAEKFLQNQRLSYGQLLSLLLGVEGMVIETGVPLLQVQLVLEGEGLEITMPSSKSHPQRGKQAVTFRYPHCALGNLGWVWNTCPVLPASLRDLTVPPCCACVPVGSRAVLQHMAVGLALSFLPCSFSNRLHEAEEGVEPSLSAFSFQRLLSNLTALRLRVSHGPGQGECLRDSSPWGPSWERAGDIPAASGSQG